MPVVDGETLTVDELLARFIRNREEADLLEEEISEMEVTVDKITLAANAIGQEHDAVLTRLIGDIFRDGCPSDNPDHPSWDQYFNLVRQLEGTKI